MPLPFSVSNDVTIDTSELGKGMEMQKALQAEGEESTRWMAFDLFYNLVVWRMLYGFLWSFFFLCPFTLLTFASLTVRSLRTANRPSLKNLCNT